MLQRLSSSPNSGQEAELPDAAVVHLQSYSATLESAERCLALQINSGGLDSASYLLCVASSDGSDDGTLLQKRASFRHPGALTKAEETCIWASSRWHKS